MTDNTGAFDAALLARWLRPDADRWIRPDAARYLKPGTDPRDVFPALARKYNPSQPRVPAAVAGKAANGLVEVAALPRKRSLIVTR
jgi:hypothetical protein